MEHVLTAYRQALARPGHVLALTGAGRNASTLVDVNIEDNPFGDIAAASGGVIRAPAATALPAIVDAVILAHTT